MPRRPQQGTFHVPGVSYGNREKPLLEEAERRLREFREGRVRGIPAEELFRRVMDDIP